MLPSGLSILDSGRSKLSPGFSKIQTRFLCDLQPCFNSSGAQNTSWIIHDPKPWAVTMHSTGRASPALLAAPAERGRWLQSSVKLLGLGLKLWKSLSYVNYEWLTLRNKYRLMLKKECLRSFLIRTQQPASPQHTGPCVHLHGDCRLRDMSWSPQGTEEGPEACARARVTETTSPGHQGLLSEKWSLCLLICEWGDLREPEWVHPVPSSERGGVMGAYVLSLGPLEMAWLCPVTWPLSNSTFSGCLWSRWRL